MPEKVPFRNPFPIPDVSSEGSWIPRGPVLGKKVTPTDRRWKSKVDTHERLFAHHTLNSIRKDQRLVRTKAPSDALDFALTSAYVHNEDTLVPKMYVSMQPETLGIETWRVLRNELKTSMTEFGIPTILEEIESSSGEATGREPSERKGGHVSKMTPSLKMVARAKVEARAKTAAGSKMGAPSRSAAGSHKTAASQMTTAPKKPSEYQRSASKSTSMAPRARQGARLHQYSSGLHHHGIPDRIERIHPSTLKLAIDGPHSDQTKAGYSRKEDGNFYGI